MPKSIPGDADAVSWSLHGATLYALADVIDTNSLVDWHDELSRSQDDVTAVLSAAAEHFWPWQADASVELRLAPA